MLRIQNEYRRIARDCAQIADYHADYSMSVSGNHSAPRETDASIGGRERAKLIADVIRSRFNLEPAQVSEPEKR